MQEAATTIYELKQRYRYGKIEREELLSSITLLDIQFSWREEISNLSTVWHRKRERERKSLWAGNRCAECHMELKNETNSIS